MTREDPMIERRPFGRTGHHSSAMLFGAALTWTFVSGRLKKISVRRFFK
jgi:hypothetical protein